MLNQQPNRTSKLISDCFEDRGPLVYSKNPLINDGHDAVINESLRKLFSCQLLVK